MCILRMRARSNADIDDTVCIIVSGNSLRRNGFKWIVSALNRTQGDRESTETRADHEKCIDRSAKDFKNCRKRKTFMLM